MDNPERKIVAVGGGENGRINSSGGREPYELAEIDREIVRLSGKDHPRFLMLAHAQIGSEENEIRYIETEKRIFADSLGCEFRSLTVRNLTADPAKTREYVEWADIVYEGGGDTPAMIGLWRKTDFDVLLKEAWEKGKVMCGVSAGAICWFALGNTDAAGYREREVDKVPALGFINAYLSPHCEADWKRESEVRSLKRINKVGISLSGCAAIEIVGGGYRIIKSTPADPSKRPYALRTFWKDGVLHEEELCESVRFRPLDRLLALE